MGFLVNPRGVTQPRPPPLIHLFRIAHKDVVRPLPFFKDLQEILFEIPESQRKGFVLSRDTLSNDDSSIYNKMARAVGKTEWEQWQRLRQNLRTSCENDLLDMGYQEWQVVLWIGHTQKTSRTAYQKTKPTAILKSIEDVSF